MSKAKANSHKTFENPVGEQQKLVNMENSAQVGNHAINQNHNTTQESLGPNTRR